MTVHLLLTVAAFVLFVLGTFSIITRINPIAAGLALLALTRLL
jgi:hypothetical protein